MPRIRTIKPEFLRARAQRSLDEEHGFTSAFLAACPSCRGALEFDTDFIGRTVERCTQCGLSRLPCAPAPRPEGEAYSVYSREPKKPERRPLPETTEDPAAQLLRETRAARGVQPMRPELLEAKREFEAYEASLKDAKKGGRPKKLPSMLIGKAARRAGYFDEMPGRPERLEPRLPVMSARAASIDASARTTQPPPPPPTTTTMRTAIDCGHEVSPFGPRPKLCLDCKAEKKGEAKPLRRARAVKSGKTRRSINTGYRGEPPASTPVAPSSGLSGAIAEIKNELITLDARRAELREQLQHALDQLQDLANA